MDRIRQTASKDKKLRFNNLWHHVYAMNSLRQAYFELSKQSAPGVDGQTWNDYGKQLEENLQNLSDRLAKGTYKAPPVRRVYIPKADGKQRPIGVPAIEDKIVQQFIQHRIADDRVLRHVRKWLNAGVMERGVRTQQEEGVPQGGSISPLLANIYLHYALDLWANQWRERRSGGDLIIVRYADDFVVGFEHEQDAAKFLDDLKERFQKFGLELHDDKTRILRFGRFASKDRKRDRDGKGGPNAPQPTTFNFLGFTHSRGKTRWGRFVVLRRTMANGCAPSSKASRRH